MYAPGAVPRRLTDPPSAAKPARAPLLLPRMVSWLRSPTAPTRFVVAGPVPSVPTPSVAS